jgi:hypothetical protein
MARQLRSQLDQEVQLDEMLREQKPASSSTPAGGAAAAGTAAGAAAAANATTADYGAEATAPPPPAASDAGTHDATEAAIPPSSHVPPAFANPPAVGPGAPEVGAPTDDLHSHGHEAPATAPAAWDDPSLAPSSYSPERIAAPAAEALAPTPSHDPRDVARHS